MVVTVWATKATSTKEDNGAYVGGKIYDAAFLNILDSHFLFMLISGAEFFKLIIFEFWGVFHHKESFKEAADKAELLKGFFVGWGVFLVCVGHLI